METRGGDRELRRIAVTSISAMLVLVCVTSAVAQLPSADLSAVEVTADAPTAEKPSAADDTPANVLTTAEWKQVDGAVNRALSWLAAQQQDDGSFPTIPNGQPGVTSLSMMAFVAQGHMPGDGTYGKRLENGIDFVLSCQKENGLIALTAPDSPRLSRVIEYEVGDCAAYNHAISSLALCELYGMSGDAQARRIQAAVDRSLATSLEMQRWPKSREIDRGGWRYIQDTPGLDSDMSITGWELMFLRSARNAGFNVPKEPIDEAVEYVRRNFNAKYGAFQYLSGTDDHRSRCMAGAGILALAHAGYHNSPEAQRSGEWILQHDFERYNQFVPFNAAWQHDRYHYGLLNCCQGMYQLGGRYWEEFFPRTVRTLLANQQADGSWPSDSHTHDGQFGNAYTTALVVITLGAPNQLLPIFQR